MVNFELIFTWNIIDFLFSFQKINFFEIFKILIKNNTLDFNGMTLIYLNILIFRLGLLSLENINNVVIFEGIFEENIFHAGLLFISFWNHLILFFLIRNNDKIKEHQTWYNVFNFFKKLSHNETYKFFFF